MRYPLGYRQTWADAFQAAFESACMTGMKYRVEQVEPSVNEGRGAGLVWGRWEFAPRVRPVGDGAYHMAVRV